MLIWEFWTFCFRNSQKKQLIYQKKIRESNFTPAFLGNFDLGQQPTSLSLFFWGHGWTWFSEAFFTEVHELYAEFAPPQGAAQESCWFFFPRFVHGKTWCQVLPSDLFGCFKWPFQGLSDLHLGYQMVTWKKLVDDTVDGNQKSGQLTSWGW